MLYALEAVPDAVAVPAGAFADPNFPAPRVQVYGERSVGWCALALP